MSVIIIGADPGRSAAVAVVEVAPNGRTLFLGAWNIHGAKSRSSTTERAWGRSLDICLRELGTLAPMVTRIWCETPAQKGKSKRGKLGPDVWLNMGRFQGELCRGLRTLYGMDVRLVPQDEWAKELGVPNGKSKRSPFGNVPEGWHRCAEAAQHAEGFAYDRDPTTAAAAEREVAKAEAVLIAACGAQRWRAHGPA